MMPNLFKEILINHLNNNHFKIQIMSTKTNYKMSILEFLGHLKEMFHMLERTVMELQ